MFNFIKPLLTAVLVIKLGTTFGQTFTYPIIKKQVLTISDLIPPGWILLDSANGDLNKDKLNDLALVLQHKDSVIIYKTEDGFTDTVLTQPRILLIFFHETSTNNYQLVEQSNTFILNNDNPSIQDPFQKVRIEKGILFIDFHIFCNIGSWYITNTTYQFRYQNQSFTLIGADNNSFHRATQDYENYSYNFLTKKWSLTTGNDSTENKPKTEWHQIQLKELKTLKTLVRPYSWEVTKDVYL